MFCGKCGANNTEGATFCKSCGEKLGEAVSAELSGSKKNNNKVIGIVAVSVLAVVIVVCFAVFAGGRSYKATIEDLITSTFEIDARTIISLIPEEAIEYALDKEDMSKRELIEEIDYQLEKSVKQYDRYFDNWEYSYEITEVVDTTGKKLKGIKEDYKDELDIAVKAAKNVTVETKITADDDFENTNSMELLLIKVGNSWYLDVYSMGDLF